MNEPIKRISQSHSLKVLFLLSFLFIAIFLISFFYPESWWATHFVYYLAVEWQFIIGILCVSLIFIACFYPRFITDKLERIWKSSRHIPASYKISFITLIFGCLFYNFPIYFDNYGDSFFFHHNPDFIVTKLPDEIADALTALSLKPDTGRKFVFALIHYLSYLLNVSYRQIFVWTGVFGGSVWVFSWLYFTHSQIRQPITKYLIALLGICPPMMGTFFGHFETYTPIYLAILWWCILLLKYCQKRRVKHLILLIFLQLILIRLHLISILFIPALFVLIFSHCSSRYPAFKKYQNWKCLIKYIIIPIYIIGLIIYFVILQDHVDPRVLKQTTDAERLFLPIFSPQAPYDRYNLFGFYHLHDFFNAILFWSTPLILTFIVVVIYNLKKIQWQSLPVLSLGLSLILFISFLFMFNPLRTLPMDWDIYCLPVPIILVLTLWLFRNYSIPSNIRQRLLIICISLSLLHIPFYFVNASKDAYSERIEHIGKRVFKSYYEWSSRQLDFAINLVQMDSVQYLSRYKNVLEDLEPFALIGNDEQYAQLQSNLGNYYFKIQSYTEALLELNKAYKFDPSHKLNILRLVEAHFELDQFEQALNYAEKLIKYNYPNEKKALRMAIHIALESGARDIASNHSNAYLLKWPDDHVIQEIAKGIQQNVSLENLILNFAKK